MNLIKNCNIEVFFEPEEQQAADLISGACEKSLDLIKDNWELSPPENCRIFVMSSGVRFFFLSAPWKWKILLSLSFPFWYKQVNGMWRYSGAWTQRYGNRVVIGIKSPSALEKSDRSIGDLVFVAEPDIKNKIRYFTCHELVHACAAPLRLPMWLNEGIAIITVDRFAGRQTVRADSLELVRDFLPKGPPRALREIYRQGKEEIAYHTIRGYWLTRYLETFRPGFLKETFSQLHRSKGINEKVIGALEMDPASFWRKIDEVVVKYFTK